MNRLLSRMMGEFLIALVTAFGGGALLTKVIDHFLTADVREFDQAALIREELRAEIDRLRDDNNELRSRITRLEGKVQERNKENIVLYKENLELKAEIGKLIDRVQELEDGRTADDE